MPGQIYADDELCETSSHKNDLKISINIEVLAYHITDKLREEINKIQKLSTSEEKFLRFSKFQEAIELSGLGNIVEHIKNKEMGDTIKDILDVVNKFKLNKTANVSTKSSEEPAQSKNYTEFVISSKKKGMLNAMYQDK